MKRAKTKRSGNSAVFLAIISMFTLGALGLGLLHTLGVPLIPRENVAVKPSGPELLSFKSSPAQSAFRGLLNAPPTPYTATSDVVYRYSSALPLTCLSETTPATLSLSRDYTANGVDTSATLSAYGAGLGALAFSQLRSALENCPSATVSDYTAGTESFYVSAATLPIAQEVVAVRRGDVIALLSSPSADAVKSMVGPFDAALSDALSSCLNQNSLIDDAVRSPYFNRPAYQGLLRVDPVSVPAPALPSIPEEEKVRTPPVVEVALPAPDAGVQAVVRPKTPNYPVWPLLPTEKPLPVLPNVPTAPQITGTVSVPLADTDGPGCGWAFTNLSPPQFDSTGVDEKEVADKKALTGQLTENGKAWQTQVLDYYRAAALYYQQANDYRSYSAQVANVSGAWAAIGKQWDAYNAEYALYEKDVSARSNFFSRQTRAQKEFDAATLACQAAPQTRTSTPSPYTTTLPPVGGNAESPDSESTDAPTSAPTSAPSPSTTVITPPPTTSVIRPPSCPRRPSILDQSAPGVRSEPTPPADPRPLYARD